jgi:hypothetical protein
MTLNTLNDAELETQLKKLIQRERKILQLVILHIQEVHRRKIYLAKAYPSLFEYLIKEFGYSSSAAQRRVEAARLVTEFPQIAEKIETGELNLSQIGEIQKSIKQSERIHQRAVDRELIAQILQATLGKSTSETQQICAELLNIPIKDKESIRTQADHSKRIEVTLTAAQFEKYQQVRGLVAQENFAKNRSMEFADILETCFDFILDSKLGPKSSNDMPATPQESQKNTNEPEVREDLRSVTPRTKKIIFRRDQCCQYQDPETGRRCSTRFNLQIDHIQFQFAGGLHQLYNLRLLCAEHNRYRYNAGLGKKEFH